MNIVIRLLWWAAKLHSPSAGTTGVPCRFSFWGAMRGRMDLYYDGSSIAPPSFADGFAEGLQKGLNLDLYAGHSLFPNRERPGFCKPSVGTDNAVGVSHGNSSE